MKVDVIKMATIQGQKKITVKKLSELSGISRQQISNIRSGAATRELTVLRIAKALGVDLEEIIQKEGKDGN